MGIRLSSQQQQEVVLENMGLVRYWVNKLGITPNNSNYEDLISIGTIGLIKAVATFDPTKKIKLATYASRCIKNELTMHYRGEKKHVNDISLDEPIAIDNDGSELTLRDIIPSSSRDFVEEIVEKEDFRRFISITLNLLEPRERLIMLHKIAGKNQRAIAEILNFSQSYISRLEKKINKKVKSYFFNTTKRFKEVFSMATVGEFYQISFASEEVKHFNKVFATLLKNLTNVEDLPDFKVSCNKKRIIIEIPAHLECFSFIAQIIQEIDNFSMEYVSKKNTFADNNNLQKMEKNDTNERKEAGMDTIVEDAVDTSSVKEPKMVENSNIQDGASNSTEKKNDNKAKRVRDYMLSLESFTVKELRQHFPDVTPGTINNVLMQAKINELITSIERGKYKVTKN